MRYRYMPSRMAKIEITDNSMLAGTWSHRSSQSLLGEAACDTTLEDSWVVSYKTNTLSPCDPAIVSLVFTQRS